MKKTNTKTKATKKASTKKTTSKNKKVVKKTSKKPVKKVTKKVAKKTTKKPVKKVAKRKVAKKKDIIEIPVEPILEEPIIEQQYKQNNNIKLKVSLILNVVLSVLLLLSVFVIFEKSNYKNNTVEKQIAESIGEYLPKEFQNEWNENHNKAYVQDDYVGQIIFESGIIDEPVLQGETNETYLNRNFETYKYEVCGPAFLDYACSKRGDQNTVIYGHTRSTGVDPEHVMMFSPLHLLTEQSNYESNKLIYIAYEDSVDVYLIASVYDVKIELDEDGTQYLAEGEPLYYLNKYSKEEFKEYKQAIIQRQYYDTGITFDENDTLLTLQTCFEGMNDKFIVVAKKLDTKEYKK